ncbi:hypothetical protein SPBR_09258 [Sporothrix brasiliensis 5110]|uniref:Uncharacterized protein n=1 Tax=Sporothrix brasiliensis 5110 TaxID=1398154 RepID=A0A0C2J867_9PEZI|nr:uncharacterized protein SPBR_09258 [Sporothrix brasiliensis 5110]KIH95190.1 hypothetical protein SPBR_09258 [Sporothrix brasiliensis 5110]
MGVGRLRFPPPWPSPRISAHFGAAYPRPAPILVRRTLDRARRERPTLDLSGVPSTSRRERRTLDLSGVPSTAPAESGVPSTSRRERRTLDLQSGLPSTPPAESGVPSTCRAAYPRARPQRAAYPRAPADRGVPSAQPSPPALPHGPRPKSRRARDSRCWGPCVGLYLFL